MHGPTAEIGMTRGALMRENINIHGSHMPRIHQSSSMVMMGMSFSIHKVSLRMFPNLLWRHSCDPIYRSVIVRSGQECRVLDSLGFTREPR